MCIFLNNLGRKTVIEERNCFPKIGDCRRISNEKSGKTSDFVLE